MPYASNADLPKGVKGLPAAAQTIFRKAFNSISSENPDYSDTKIFKMAWGAVKNAGWHQNAQGEWVHDAASNVINGIEHEAGCEALDTGSNADCSCGAADALPPEFLKKKKKKSGDGAFSVVETITLDEGADTRRTSEGYLLAYPRVARTGIQLYTGDEVGKPDMEVVRVYRPEDEIFSNASMHSYAGKPVTVDHPPVMLDAFNWRKYAVGEIGDEVVRDGNFVRVPMMLRDAAAIKEFEQGKDQLSLGYTMDLKWESGRTPDGETYDAMQTNVRANHLAVVAAARGGSHLRIGDDRRDDMSVKTITVDGLKVSMDERDADIVTRALDKAQAELARVEKLCGEATDAIKLRDSQLSEIKKTVDAKDAEIAALKQQLKEAEITPARLDQLVKDRADVVAKAKKLTGDKVVIDGKTIDEIRRFVIDAKLGQVAKDYTPAQVQAAFDAFVATGGPVASDPLRTVIRDGQLGGYNAEDATDAAYRKMVERNENAWRNQPAKAQ